MSKQRMSDAIGLIACLSISAVFLYYGAAWTAFQWRNPKANQMSYYRDFGAVMTWKKMEKYQ